jgi:hypothetical protein
MSVPRMDRAERSPMMHDPDREPGDTNPTQRYTPDRDTVGPEGASPGEAVGASTAASASASASEPTVASSAPGVPTDAGRAATPSAAAPQPPSSGWASPPPSPPAPTPAGWSSPPPAARRRQPSTEAGRDGSIVFGLILLAIGVWFLADQTLGLVLPRIDWGRLWPLFLIAFGLWIAIGSMRRGSR